MVLGAPWTRNNTSQQLQKRKTATLWTAKAKSNIKTQKKNTSPQPPQLVTNLTSPVFQEQRQKDLQPPRLASKSSPRCLVRPDLLVVHRGQLRDHRLQHLHLHRGRVVAPAARRQRQEDAARLMGSATEPGAVAEVAGSGGWGRVPARRVGAKHGWGRLGGGVEGVRCGSAGLTAKRGGAGWSERNQKRRAWGRVRSAQSSVAQPSLASERASFHSDEARNMEVPNGAKER